MTRNGSLWCSRLFGRGGFGATPEASRRFSDLTLASFTRAHQFVSQSLFAPVTSDEASRLQGPIDVGAVNGFGDRLGLSTKDLCLGLVGFGAPGSGKTHLACGIADQILKVPPKQRGFTVLFVQLSSKSDAHSFAVKYPWVKCLDMADLPYNFWEPMEGEDPRDRMRHGINCFAFENYLGSLAIPVLSFALDKAYRAKGSYEGRKSFPCFSDVAMYAPEFRVPGYEMSSVLGKLLARIKHFESFPLLNVRRGRYLKLFFGARRRP